MAASALVPPRLPGRTAAHFASHRPCTCTSRGGRHRHSAASYASTAHHLLRLSPKLAPWCRRLQAFAPLASPRRWRLHSLAPGIRVDRQACRDEQGRLDGRFGRRRCVHHIMAARRRRSTPRTVWPSCWRPRVGWVARARASSTVVWPKARMVATRPATACAVLASTRSPCS